MSGGRTFPWCVLAGVLVASLPLAMLPALAANAQRPANGPGQAEQALVVTVATARRQVVEDWRPSVGTLEALASPKVAAEVAGRIEKVLVDEGDEVRKGQLLAVIDKTDYRLAVEQAKAAVAQAQAQLRGFALRLARVKRLVAKGSAPQSVLDNTQAAHDAVAAALSAARARLRKAQRALEKTEIRSPVAGRVQKRLVSAGDFIGAGHPAFVITSEARLRARLPVAEALAPMLKPGLPVRLESPLTPGQVVETHITALAPAVDPASRAVHVLAVVDNPGGWKPGASVKGAVRVAQRESVVVPAVSLVLRPRGHVVYVLRGPTAHEVRVTPGLTLEGGLVEIRNGLRGGETVVAEGAGFLRDGQPVKVAVGGADGS